MTKNYIYPVAAALMAVTVGASLAFAQTDGIDVLKSPKPPHATASAKKNEHQPSLETAKQTANQEIVRRISVLNDLGARMDQTLSIPQEDKLALVVEIQHQKNSLDALKSRVQNDASTTSLQSDVKSVSEAYRVYRLVIPKDTIIAAADRVTALAQAMQTVGNKLQARISTARSSGADMTQAQSALDNYDAKIADALSLASDAQNAVTVLQPDNGDKTAFESNQQALKDARAKIQAAQKDLVAARKYIDDVRRDLEDSETVTATSTPQTSTSTAQTASSTPAVQI